MMKTSISHLGTPLIALNLILAAPVAFAAGAPSGSANAASGSKDVKFRDTDVEIQEGDRIVINGIRGSIRLNQTGGQPYQTAATSSANSSSKGDSNSSPAATVATADAAPAVQTRTITATLRAHKMLNEKSLAQWSAKFENLTLQTRKDGHVIYIEAKGPQTASDWTAWTAAGSPEMAIELSVNSSRGTPVEVSLHDGTIDVKGWQANVSASVVQGTIRTDETVGDLQVQVQHGDMRVTKQRGAVDVDSFKGKLIADRVDGDVHLDNFSGESNLKNIAGNVFVRTHTGATNVADSSGAIDFELGRGALNVAKFEGPVRGQTDTAPVVAKLEGESDVNIESAQGPVAVRLPASSGAAIRLQTETGSLNVPEEIRPTQTTSTKFASGRMKGAGPKGSVTIKSKAASIRVRPDSGGASGKAETESAPATRAPIPDSTTED